MSEGRRLLFSGRFKGLLVWARQLRVEVLTLFFAVRHPHTPWYSKLIAALVVGYALSPIDLIPDFIPVLGLLDEVILLPAGIALALRLMPPAILADCRESAASLQRKLPRLWLGALVIVLIWIAIAYLIIRSLL